jgi:hypothetical protein
LYTCTGGSTSSHPALLCSHAYSFRPTSTNLTLNENLPSTIRRIAGVSYASSGLNLGSGKGSSSVGSDVDEWDEDDLENIEVRLWNDELREVVGFDDVPDLSSSCSKELEVNERRRRDRIFANATFGVL